MFVAVTMCYFLNDSGGSERKKLCQDVRREKTMAF